MAQTVTVASPPNTNEVTQQILASLAAQSGVVTDYNIGSQIRTLAESIGSVEEISSISALTTALQVIAYSAMSIFGITPNAAVPAVGTVLFATAFLTNPPPAVQNVPIPIGTLLQTLGGIQFQTTSGMTLTSGATGVVVPVEAVNGGFNTNVPAGSIQQLISGLLYPLSVTNTAATSGGLDAESPSQALSRLSAKFASLVGGSPVSVANAAIGVMASGSSETVVYSCCYEGWADPANPGFGTEVGFAVYVDNGSGSASDALLAAVGVKLNGNFNTNTPAYRPAGVPYGIFADDPIFANVSVSGTLGPLSNPSQINGAIQQAVSGYFTLPFGQPASQGPIAADVANAALGQLTSLSVNLYYANAPSTAVNVVSGALYQRVILNQLVINLST